MTTASTGRTRRGLGGLTPLERAGVVVLAILVVAAGVFAFRFVTRTEPAPLPAVSSEVRSGPAAHGYLVSADASSVVIELGNGQRREFVVRDQERGTIGLPYLEHHAGNRETGFLIFYGTQAGRDHVIGAVETDIPLPGQG